MSMEVRRAVVVEDNPRFRELVKVVLDSLGIADVAEARDGGEAIEVLQTFDADVVIMDWSMEGMDGIACTQHIRSGTLGCDPNLPIVMVSGHSGDDAIRQAHDAGVDVYLVKPISLKALHAGIQKAVSGPTGPATGPVTSGAATSSCAA